MPYNMHPYCCTCGFLNDTHIFRRVRCKLYNNNSNNNRHDDDHHHRTNEQSIKTKPTLPKVVFIITFNLLLLYVLVYEMRIICASRGAHIPSHTSFTICLFPF